MPYTLNGKRVEVPVKKASVSFLLRPDRRGLGPRSVGAGTLPLPTLITHAWFNIRS